MSTSFLRIDVVGQPRAKAVFDKLEDALDVEGILDEGAAILLNRTRTRFLQQVDPDGIAWLPSRAALRRQISGRGGGTLFDTGNLFHSIQLARSELGARFIGTDVPYGVHHQEGIPPMPKRQFLGFGEEDVSLMTSLVIKRLSESLNGIT